MYSCMVPLLVLWLSMSSCSGITVKRLERRFNLLESRVHDDSMAFRSDLDTLFAIVNDTSVSGKHQPSEGNTTDHCAETQQGSMTDDYVRRFQRDIDQQMNVAKRGLMAEKAWIRQNIERVENNVTLLTQDITDHVATMVANLADIKQPLEQKLNVLSGEMDTVKVSMTDHVSTMEANLVKIRGDLDARCKPLEEKLNMLSGEMDTVKVSMTDHVSTMEANFVEIRGDLDARCEEEKLNMLSEVVNTVKENMQAVQASLEVMSVTFTEKVQSVENRLKTVKSNAEKQTNIVEFMISRVINTGNYTVKSHAGKVYAYSSNETTWAEAVAECQSIGGYLVEINSLAENTFIVDAFDGNHWIGASDAAEEGKWIWNHSKEPVTTAFWARDYLLRNADCAAISHYGYNWYDVPCLLKWRYICELTVTNQ